MSIYKIYDQATGKVVENGATANPIVVELNTERVNIKNILKDGNDLIVTLNSGEEITVKEFYNGEDANKLVIKETDGLYYEVNLSQLNEQGLFEAVDYTPIENFTDYLYWWMKYNNEPINWEVPDPNLIIIVQKELDLIRKNEFPYNPPLKTLLLFAI